MHLSCRGRRLSLDRVAVMGVLNVTPDSFSDGGLYLSPERAIQHGIEMSEQGAVVIDVGGESTRPGADPVSESEEADRVLPVIETLARHVDAAISIDTRKPGVARAAVAAGASIVNDTSGESFDPAMDEVAAETGAAIIVMHSRGTPATMRNLTEYGDVTAEIGAFLSSRVNELLGKGVSEDSIVLDPGFGFAKKPEQNLEMLRRMTELTSLGYPLLVGTSRKSFIGALLEVPEDERLEGTLATLAWSVCRDAAIVRVHDVRPAVLFVRMLEEIGGPRCRTS